MTSIYLINNCLTMNNLNFPNNESLVSRREKRVLSIDGEKESEVLANSSLLETTQIIYSSPYVMSIGTAKYLANKLELDINIKSEIGERKIGLLGNNKISQVTEMQETNFDYKLSGGESLNEVKSRMLSFIQEVLEHDKDKNIAVFTHNVAITSLLSEYCTKGYNLDNRLILNYGEDAIIDGTWDGINIIELDFQDDKIVNVIRRK